MLEPCVTRPGWRVLARVTRIRNGSLGRRTVLGNSRDHRSNRMNGYVQACISMIERAQG